MLKHLEAYKYYRNKRYFINILPIATVPFLLSFLLSITAKQLKIKNICSPHIL